MTARLGLGPTTLALCAYVVATMAASVNANPMWFDSIPS